MRVFGKLVAEFARVLPQQLVCSCALVCVCVCVSRYYVCVMFEAWTKFYIVKSSTSTHTNEWCRQRTKKTTTTTTTNIKKANLILVIANKKQQQQQDHLRPPCSSWWRIPILKCKSVSCKSQTVVWLGLISGGGL